MTPEARQATAHRTPVFLDKDDLDALVQLLRDEGYEVIGPVISDGAVRLLPITSAAQIARGVRDEQEGGHYRLVETDPNHYFDYVVGPDSPKRYFFPPVQKLVSLHIEGEQFVLDDPGPQPRKLALIGVRPCELAAISVQDRVFGHGADDRPFRCESDTYYQRTREQSLLIAVNCHRPGGTCFCASWGTGPAAKTGFDLALTELRAGFVVTVGSDKGAAIVDGLPVREATSAELELEELKLRQACDEMGRQFDPRGVKELLDRNIEHPEWNEVAKRCLACTNCTMVCPTCFCSTVVDGNDLSGKEVSRTRYWESCYTDEFTYTTGGSVRRSIRARYRHWLRHKLDTWWDQFGCSGCVGCGRCITWCPVGIDLTEEVQRIRGNDQGAKTAAAQEEYMP